VLPASSVTRASQDVHVTAKRPRWSTSRSNVVDHDEPASPWTLYHASSRAISVVLAEPEATVRLQRSSMRRAAAPRFAMHVRFANIV